jgi:hypothetical protein
MRDLIVATILAALTLWAAAELAGSAALRHAPGAAAPSPAWPGRTGR